MDYDRLLAIKQLTPPIVPSRRRFAAMRGGATLASVEALTSALGSEGRRARQRADDAVGEQ